MFLTLALCYYFRFAHQYICTFAPQFYHVSIPLFSMVSAPVCSCTSQPVCSISWAPFLSALLAPILFYSLAPNCSRSPALICYHLFAPRCSTFYLHQSYYIFFYLPLSTSFWKINTIKPEFVNPLMQIICLSSQSSHQLCPFLPTNSSYSSHHIFRKSAPHPFYWPEC